MTTPATPELPFDVSDLLVTTRELEVWTQQPVGSLEDDIFALAVLWGTTILVRDAGLDIWTAATIPDRAKLVAVMVAKNYYEHPDGEISNTTAVISSRYIDAVVHNMELMPEQVQVLERIAAEEGETAPAPGDFGDLQVLTTTRGPLETRRRRGQPVYLRDAQGNLIAYADSLDLPVVYALTPPSELP